MRARSTFTLLALAAGLFAADQWIAPRILGAEGPQPPFGLARDPVLIERLEERRRQVLNGSQPNVLNGFDAHLGWSNHEGSSKLRGHVIQVGPNGTRGSYSYPSPKPEGITRIVCVGDSFIWGSEVGDTDTMPYVLEQQADIEAPNLAVGGYGLDQSLLRLRQLGADLQPDVVVFGCMLATAGRNGSRIPGRYNPTNVSQLVKPRFRLEQGELQLVPAPYADELSLLDAALKGQNLIDMRAHEVWLDPVPWLSFSRVAQHRALRKSLEARDPRVIWEDLNGECMQVTMALIEAIHAQARTLGAQRSLFLLFPNRSVLMKASRGVPRYWADALAQLESPYLDLTDALLAALPEPSESASPARRGDFLFERTHLSLAGNRVVAEAVLTWLREE